MLTALDAGKTELEAAGPAAEAGATAEGPQPSTSVQPSMSVQPSASLHTSMHTDPEDWAEEGEEEETPAPSTSHQVTAARAAAEAAAAPSAAAGANAGLAMPPFEGAGVLVPSATLHSAGPAGRDIEAEGGEERRGGYNTDASAAPGGGQLLHRAPSSTAPSLATAGGSRSQGHESAPSSAQGMEAEASAGGQDEGEVAMQQGGAADDEPSPAAPTVKQEPAVKEERQEEQQQPGALLLHQGSTTGAQLATEPHRGLAGGVPEASGHPSSTQPVASSSAARAWGNGSERAKSAPPAQREQQQAAAAGAAGLVQQAASAPGSSLPSRESSQEPSAALRLPGAPLGRTGSWAAGPERSHLPVALRMFAHAAGAPPPKAPPPASGGPASTTSQPAGGSSLLANGHGEQAAPLQPSGSLEQLTAADESVAEVLIQLVDSPVMPKPPPHAVLAQAQAPLPGGGAAQQGSSAPQQQLGPLQQGVPVAGGEAEGTKRSSRLAQKRHLRHLHGELDSEGEEQGGPGGLAGQRGRPRATPSLPSAAAASQSGGADP